MTDEQKQELEDWQELLASDGWKWLSAYAQQNWTSGDAFKRRALVSLKSVGVTESVAQILAASQAVEELMRYPQSRVSALKPNSPTNLDRFKAQRRTP